MAWEKSKLLGLAATFMFAAAVFLIAGDNILVGAILFTAATCFACAAGLVRREEAISAKRGTGGGSANLDARKTCEGTR